MGSYNYVVKYMDYCDLSQDVIPFVLDLKQRRGLNKTSRKRAYEEFLFHVFESISLNHSRLSSILRSNPQSIFMFYSVLDCSNPGDSWDEIYSLIGTLSSSYKIRLRTNGVTTGEIQKHGTSMKEINTKVFANKFFLSDGYRDYKEESTRIFDIDYLSLAKFFLSDGLFNDLRQESEKYGYVLKEFMKKKIMSCDDGGVFRKLVDPVLFYWLVLNIESLGGEACSSTDKLIRFPTGSVPLRVNDFYLKHRYVNKLLCITQKLVCDAIDKITHT